MLKTALLFFMLVAFGKIFTQTCSNCAALFTWRFLAVPIPVDTLPVWHFNATPKYKPETEAEAKRTEDYNYIHNGDPLKGATDVFTSNVQGADWFRNFDFGEFAKITIDVGPDRNGRPNGVFQWGGKLLFFNIIKNKKLAQVPYRGN